MNAPHHLRPAAGPDRLPPTPARVRRAFTLIEMIIVISIISVLLGLLYGSLERARTFSRRAIAFIEIKNIEAALRQYYAHYHEWPADTLVDALSQPLTSGQDGGFVIDAPAAAMLQGTLSDSSPQALRDANPDRIPFVEFARFSNVGQEQGAGVPVNPFHTTSSTLVSRQYKVLFDLNGDNQILVTDASAPGFSTNVFKRLAVWTLIPGKHGSKSDGTGTVNDEVLGNWNTFETK